MYRPGRSWYHVINPQLQSGKWCCVSFLVLYSSPSLSFIAKTIWSVLHQTFPQKVFYPSSPPVQVVHPWPPLLPLVISPLIWDEAHEDVYRMPSWSCRDLSEAGVHILFVASGRSKWFSQRVLSATFGDDDARYVICRCSLRHADDTMCMFTQTWPLHKMEKSVSNLRAQYRKWQLWLRESAKKGCLGCSMWAHFRPCLSCSQAHEDKSSSVPFPEILRFSKCRYT